MSLSNGRYEIHQDEHVWYMLTLEQNAPGATITVFVRNDEPSRKEWQWDSIGLANGNILFQNVKTKLFLGRSWSSVVATLEPYEWALEKQDLPDKYPFYAITVPCEIPARCIDINGDHDKAVLGPLQDGDNTRFYWRISGI